MLQLDLSTILYNENFNSVAMTIAWNILQFLNAKSGKHSVRMDTDWINYIPNDFRRSAVLVLDYFLEIKQNLQGLGVAVARSDETFLVV